MRPALHITWSKAFGEVYCHHASLFIPFNLNTLFPPEIVRVGVTIRANNLDKGKIYGYSDKDMVNFLPCKYVEGGLNIPLNSTLIVDGISLNVWTSLRGGDRGTLKEFPIRLTYQIGDDEVCELPFDPICVKTPYLYSEKHFTKLYDGDKVDVTIYFD